MSTLRHSHLPDSARLSDVLRDRIQRGGGSLRWAAAAREMLNFMGLDRHFANDVDLVREMAVNATMGDAIDSLFGAAIVAGFEDEPDTTVPWTREMPAKNFRQSELYSLATGARMKYLPTGGTAEEADYGLGKTTYRIARYARQIVVSEQDMVDGKPLNAVMFAVGQLGAEARRLRADLVYSLILANPTMQPDNTALFHTDHKNEGTGALGTAGLSAGLAAIGNQVILDEDGAPIHTNHSGKVLVVPPDLVEVARRTVRNISLCDGRDITVLPESRLGTSGVLDPTDGETVRVGTATNWMLCGNSRTRPAVVVLGLNGNLTPRIQRFMLDRGEWGMGWQICLDIGAVAVDHQGLYWSAGTA